MEKKTEEEREKETRWKVRLSEKIYLKKWRNKRKRKALEDHYDEKEKINQQKLSSHSNYVNLDGVENSYTVHTVEQY
jgi:hypothetical protein